MLDSRQAIIQSAIRIKPTLGNPKWLFAHRNLIRNALPESWTPVTCSSLRAKFGFFLTVAGVEWRETADLILAMNWLVKVGIAEARCDPDISTISRHSISIRKSRQPIS